MARMTAKVIKPKDLVISVPHSGTRSLVAHLGLKTFHHFRHQPARPDVAETIHIPIRNPMYVAGAWARRGKSIRDLLECYRLMFDFLGRARNYKLYRMEDYPNEEGSGDEGQCSESVTEAYQRKIQRLVVNPNSEFFRRFY